MRFTECVTPDASHPMRHTQCDADAAEHIENMVMAQENQIDLY
jgi:thiamine phosphate synthase YjbQ (UPF0047 family)